MGAKGRPRLPEPLRDLYGWEPGVAELIYMAITSLDGYVEDAEGNFDWAAPDEEVHAFVNDLERPVGTYLYGRRMYETMVFWETAGPGREPAVVAGLRGDLAGGRQDRLLHGAGHGHQCEDTDRARLRRRGGAGVEGESGKRPHRRRPGLAAQAIEAGLVDEYQLFLVPVVVGGGNALRSPTTCVGPGVGRGTPLRSGAVFLRYRTSD